LLTFYDIIYSIFTLILIVNNNSNNNMFLLHLRIMYRKTKKK